MIQYKITWLAIMFSILFDLSESTNNQNKQMHFIEKLVNLNKDQLPHNTEQVHQETKTEHCKGQLRVHISNHHQDDNDSFEIVDIQTCLSVLSSESDDSFVIIDHGELSQATKDNCNIISNLDCFIQVQSSGMLNLH